MNFDSDSNKSMVITHANGIELRSHGGLQHFLYTSRGAVSLTFVQSISGLYQDRLGEYHSRERVGRKMTVKLDLPW